MVGKEDFGVANLKFYCQTFLTKSLSFADDDQSFTYTLLILSRGKLLETRYTRALSGLEENVCLFTVL